MISGGGFSADWIPSETDRDRAFRMTGDLVICRQGEQVLALNANLSPEVFPVWALVIRGSTISSVAEGRPESAKAIITMGSGYSAPIVKRVDVGVGTIVTVPAGSVEVTVDCTIPAIVGVPATRGSGEFSVMCIPAVSVRSNAFYTQPIITTPPNSFSVYAPIPPFASEYMFRWNPPPAGFPAGATLAHITSPVAESPVVTTTFRAGFTYGASSALNPRDIPMPWQPIPSAGFVEIYNLDLAFGLPGDFIFRIR